MFVLPSDAWKLVLAIVLGATIFTAAYGSAPRRKVPYAELRRLVASALGLYAVGTLATLSDHPTLAAFVYAAGITICAFALWLSRGRDSGDDPPRGGEEPTDEGPPPDPEGLPEFDFAAFERQFREYAAEHSRELAPH
jgi:hypothetical protein